MKSYTFIDSAVFLTLLYHGFCFNLNAYALQSQVVYVNLNATGANDGSSWADAFIKLQDGIDTVIHNPVYTGAEVWVAQGTYKPTNRRYSAEPQSVAFNLLDGVMVYGGFNGTESNRSQRDWINNETILSGDIDDDGVLDTDNAWHVVEADTEHVSLTGGIDGFTVTMGYADGQSPEWSGGGVYIQHESPAISNCKIINNYAYKGMGCYIESGSPIIRNCTISNNGTNTSTCSGAITCESNASPLIIDCIIQGNRGRSGGAIYCYSGSAPSFTNCLITGNKGSVGGAMRSINSNPKFYNCAISKNTAEASGGGITSESGVASLINCILWGNTPNEINGAPAITYSDIKGNWLGVGNINADPCFANPDANDFHLKSQAGRWNPSSQSWVIDSVTSPCIDAGNMADPLGFEPFPNGGRINMGAYGGTEQASKSYFGRPTCQTIMAGDINGDCRVNFLDFAILASHWLWEE